MATAAGIIFAGAAGAGAAAVAGTSILKGILIGGALGAASQLLAPKPPKLNLGEAGAPDIDTRSTAVAAIEGARWILGRARTGGSMKFYEETNDGRDVWMAVALSEGACDAIERIWIDGEEVKFTRSGAKLSIGGEFDGNAAIYEYFAADGRQGAEIRQACDGFTAQHRFAGLSWMAIHLHQPEYDDLDGRFWSRRPEVHVLVKGLKITWPGQSKPAWTENAAALRRFVEIERGGLDPDAVDEAAFAAAYRVCGAEVTIPAGSSRDGYARSGIRYAVNGTLTADMQLDRVRQEIDYCWQGSAVESGGVQYFLPGADRAAVGALGEDDLLSVAEVRPAPSFQDRVNAVSMSLTQCRDTDYQPFDVPETEDSAALARDGDFYLPQDAGTRLFMTGALDALRVQSILLRRARPSMTVACEVRPGPQLERYGWKPGDRVTLTSGEYGFSDALFEINSISVNQGDLSVSLALNEVRAGAFADTLDLPPIMRRTIDIAGPYSPLAKPGSVTVTIAARQSDDGAFAWYALVTVPAGPWEMVVRYRPAGEDAANAQETMSFGRRTVIQLGSAGEWIFEVRARSRSGLTSPPTVVRATATYDINPPAAPVLARSSAAGGFARFVFSNLGPYISGLEIAYAFKPQGASGAPAAVTAASWDAAEKLGQYSIVPAQTLAEERAVSDELPKLGKYNLYARASDFTGRRSPLVALGLIEYFLNAPSSIDVTTYGDGTRAYHFSLQDSPHVQGCVIRYRKAGDIPPTPGAPGQDDTAPPRLRTADTDSDGRVVLGYSEDLDIAHAPPASAFSVAVAGTAAAPTAVALADNVVTLTLGAAPAAGQTVTVSYSPPADDDMKLQDAAGNFAAAAADVAVNNIARSAANEPDWAAMEQLHDGFLTSSPYLSRLPGAGIFDVAFRAQSASGDLSAIARTQVRLAAPINLNIAEAVKEAISNNPSLVNLTSEVEAAEAARDRAVKAAASGEAFRDAASASADAAAVDADAAEDARIAAKASETGAAGSATAAAASAVTAEASETAAGVKAAAAEASRTAAETAKSDAETAEANAASSETAADGSATAAASSADAAAASAKGAKGSADAAATSASTAETKATEAGASATAAENSKTAAATDAASAGTSADAASESETAADGSATAAASSADAAAASAKGAKGSADASSASARTATAKASEAGASAAAADSSKIAAATSETNAAASETAAAAASESAEGASASATKSSETAAGFAGEARQAVAGLDQSVSIEVDRSLATTFAAIVGLRAVAGSAKARFELVALDDPSGARAAGIMTGDMQSDTFSDGETLQPAQAAVGRGGGFAFIHPDFGPAGNGHVVTVSTQRSGGERIEVTRTSAATAVTVRSLSTAADLSIARADIVSAMAGGGVRAQGSGQLTMALADALTERLRVTLGGGKAAVKLPAQGWILRRDGTAAFDAASIRGVLSAEHIDSNVRNVDPLWEGELAINRTTRSIDLGSAADSWDFLEFYIRRGSQYNLTGVKVSDIPQNSVVSPSVVCTYRFGNDGDAEVDPKFSRSGSNLYFRQASNSGHLLGIMGIRNPEK